MIQNILVALILLVALAWGGRRLYLILKGKSSSCDGCIKPTAGSCCHPSKDIEEPYSPPDIF